MAAPADRDIPPADSPEFTTNDGVRVRVIAGRAIGDRQTAIRDDECSRIAAAASSQGARLLRCTGAARLPGPRSRGTGIGDRTGRVTYRALDHPLTVVEFDNDPTRAGAKRARRIRICVHGQFPGSKKRCRNTSCNPSAPGCCKRRHQLDCPPNKTLISIFHYLRHFVQIMQ
jgi:hypothetical protein